METFLTFAFWIGLTAFLVQNEADDRRELVQEIAEAVKTTKPS